MVSIQADTKTKWQTVRAVVTRADGTVEDRGLISFSHANTVINWIGNAYVKANYWIGEKRRNWSKLWRKSNQL